MSCLEFLQFAFQPRAVLAKVGHLDQLGLQLADLQGSRELPGGEGGGQISHMEQELNTNNKRHPLAVSFQLTSCA